MFGMDGTNDLLFSICAKQVGAGLEEQLKRFVQEHPDTKLIIIDTLQKIREAGGDKYSYANDYEVVEKLKRLADACGVCLLLVHHTRKQQADDKFDMISGTNGLSGAADGAFLLQKEKWTDDTATLDVVGRDQQDQRLYLTKDKEHLTWTLERMETELWVDPPRPGAGSHSRFCNGGKAVLVRYCHGAGSGPASGYEAQRPGDEAERPGQQTGGRVSHPL